MLEGSRALIALERLFSRMIPHMHLYIKHRINNLISLTKNSSTYLQSLFQTKRFVTFLARIRLVVCVMSNVIEPRSVTVILPAAEDASIDFSAVPRFRVINSFADVIDKLGGCFERGDAAV